MRRVTVAALLWLAGTQRVWACPACFSQATGPTADATRTGLWVLLGLTLALQGAFAAFFLYLRRQSARARSRAIDEEWSRLQRAWAGNERNGRS